MDSFDLEFLKDGNVQWKNKYNVLTKTEDGLLVSFNGSIDSLILPLNQFTLPDKVLVEYTFTSTLSNFIYAGVLSSGCQIGSGNYWQNLGFYYYNVGLYSITFYRGSYSASWDSGRYVRYASMPYKFPLKVTHKIDFNLCTISVYYDEVLICDMKFNNFNSLGFSFFLQPQQGSIKLHGLKISKCDE